MGSKRIGDGLKRALSGSTRQVKRLKDAESIGLGLGPDADEDRYRGAVLKMEVQDGGGGGSERVEYGEENASTGCFSDDTLMQIMGLFSTRQVLSRLAFVCRRWRRLSKGLVSQLLPPRCTAVGEARPESPNPWGLWAPRHRFFELVECYKMTVEKIELCGLHWLTVEDVAHIISCLPKLKDLTISSGFFPDSAALVDIAKMLPQQLLSLDLHLEPSLRALHPASLTVNDDFLVELQKRCSRLQRLDLDGHNITWKGLDGLLRACPTLTSLDVQSEKLGWPEVYTILRQCRSLRHLSLLSPLLGEDCAVVGQATRRMGSRGRDWMPTAVMGMDLMNDITMPPSLSSLRLYTSSHRSVKLESPPALGLLRKSGHQLRHLHAQGLFNSSWQTISVWCLNLEKLDLSHPKERSLDLTEIEEIVLTGLVKLLRKLESLALPSATDCILSELGRCCPRLRELRFQGHYLNCREIRPRPDVNNFGILPLIEGCPDLRVLSLAGCQSVTVSSVRFLAFHCKALEALYLSGLRDEGARALLPLLRKSLVVVDLVNCPMVTPAIFQFLMEAAEEQGLPLRVLAVSQSLIKWHQRHLKEISERLPFVRVVSSSSWDGSYHDRYF